MAELLGTIASGINVATLAVQVGQSILKLRDCWSQIKEAPDDIRIQLLQLDHLHGSLQVIQDGQAQNTIPGLPPTSLELCQEGADDLRKLVNDLAQNLDGKKGWRQKKASAQVVLKKDEMKRLKQKLNEAIQLLQFSLQCQTK